MEMTGVTTDKNLLGVITFILSLGAVWSMLASLRSRSQPHRSRHLLAQASLLAFGLLLLAMAGSATSAACFGLGAGLMVATSLPWIGRRPAAVHALVVTIVAAAGIAMLSGADADVIHAMGRKTDFTGRTDIWKAVIRLAPNPVVGAGFESFWLGQRLEKMWRAFPVFQPNEAHNGYIEVYINLGWLGVGLIVLLLINGYFRAVAAFRRDPEIGGLMLAFVGSAAVYSVTEAGFRMLNPIWIFLLLAIAGGSRIAARVGGKAQRSLVRDSKPPSMPAAPDVLPLSPTDGRVEAV
jgi:O-antigen ligase